MRRRTFLHGAGVAGGAAALGLGTKSLGARAAGAGGRAAPFDRLAGAGITVAARLTRYQGSHAIAAVDLPLAPRGAARREIAGASWACALRVALVKGRPDALELVATFKLAKGRAPEASVALALSFAGWSRDNYLFLPGACYAGNRFESRHVAYPPLLSEPADIGPNVPTIISDIPRLNLHAGPSRLQLLTSDLATPAVGLHAPAARAGVLVLTDPATPAGTTGVTVEESDDRARATLVLTAPGVREDVMYAAGNTRLRSTDRAATFRAGDEIALRLRLHLFDCADVAALFERFFAVRKDLTGPSALRHELPFSAAFKLHEERTNQRWVEAGGYYAVGARDTAYTTFQTGWCGGLMATLPLLALGSPRSRERALRNLELGWGGGQAPSGFFHGVYDGKEWSEDGFGATRAREVAARAPVYRQARRWHLIRRSADALTFLVKQLMILERQDRAWKPDARWLKSVTRCADAFVRLWDRHRQLGQFVNIDTGEIAVGGSTSGGLAPAGLALAAAYLKRDDYLRVAKAAAQHMYERYVRAGLTSGGPGDALQCPDSESAGALLESFVTLHEQTGDRAWLEPATAVAHQLASWVISHDFHPVAAAAEGDAAEPVLTTGAVLSDAQNKHGSPGYVLLSGDALFRLHRATGDGRLLELLRDTVHNLAQYLPRAEAPGRARDAAPACARADTSDWLEGSGDVVPAVGLYDTASLLAYAEVPGVYVQTDAGAVFAFDHVDARVRRRTPEGLVVTLSNPTRAEAVVRLFAEGAADTARPLGPGAMLAARLVTVPAGGSTDVDLGGPQASAAP